MARSIVRVNMVTAMCRSCGNALREGARFCDACGSPLPAAVDPAQYRQVTVLFADVVRSMDIAAAVDIERLREIMTALVERSAAVVQRYGGTAEYNGDGVMALFGAPVALEDHALRGCLAALAIQDEAGRLSAEVASRDGVDLRVRVGLNSGRVIAGEIGSGALGYRAIGDQVGLAQRMESAAPPGGVMLSESTALLVENHTRLAEPEAVHVKGLEEPIRARRLLAVNPRGGLVRRAEASLIGRRWEMAALDAIIDRAIAGRGGIVNLVGSPGIGKSRTAREAAAAATARGVEVFWTFCESHAHDVPFYAVAQLLRVGVGAADLDDEAARARVREQVPDAEPQDLLLLDDLLGIADRDVPLPQIDPEARRRRLTAMINTASLARTEPALYVIEDAQWVDAVSDSMLADFLTVIPQSKLMVLITSRPEYEGQLRRVSGAQTIALAPLGDSDTGVLLSELVGSDPSIVDLMAVIAERAAGNPFFAEEMVREFVQRGILVGEHGEYTCHLDVADVSVPATVQAAIEARIDRLDAASKRTLNAASVIGARFGAGLLAALGIEPALDELVRIELIDQVRFTPSAEYAFRHPLIRAVAYESQLRSDRAEWHRRLAAAIQESEPGLVDDNAALIAEHLESAGDLHAAYGWHMRAAGWSTARDLPAARRSWERARRIADALPDCPDRVGMRIAPRTMLCGTAWRVHVNVAGAAFEELRELCTAAGDKASLAIATSGLLMDHAYHADVNEGSRLASEVMALVEWVGDPNLTVGLSVPVSYAKAEAAEWSELFRWSQLVIDLADGDPAVGNLVLGSPLPAAHATRAIARYFMGLPGWRDDQRHALAMSHEVDPLSHAAVVSFIYFGAIPNGVLLPDDSALLEIEEALRVAERSGDDLAVTNVKMARGLALARRLTAAERDAGQQVLTEVAETFVRGEHNLPELPIVEMYLARERFLRGERDAPIPLMRAAADRVFREGRPSIWSNAATGVLVETLLARGDDGDIAEARAAIDRLTNVSAGDSGIAMRDVWLLRMETLLARARGDEAAYRALLAHYRKTVESLGYEGHIAWAAEMGC